MLESGSLRGGPQKKVSALCNVRELSFSCNVLVVIIRVHAETERLAFLNSKGLEGQKKILYRILLSTDACICTGRSGKPYGWGVLG